MTDERLTAEEILLWRAIMRDIQAGRRIACAAWKLAGIVGGIAIGVMTFLDHFWSWRS